MKAIGTVLEFEHDTEELKDHPGVLGLYLSRARFKKNGKGWETNCPFHPDKTPSCKLYLDHGRWLWRCFGACQRGGSIIDFVMESDHLGLGNAIRKTKAELGENKTTYVSAPTPEGDDKRYVTVSWANYAKAEQNLAASQKAQAWLLDKRGITLDTAKRFHLGYCKTNKYTASNTLRDQGWIIIPSIEHGEIVSIKFRSIVEKQFSRKPGMRTCLFNRGEPSTGHPLVYIVSGDFDTMVLEQAGFKSISLPGDGFTVTEEMAQELQVLGQIILAGDNDTSGLNRMQKTQAVLNAPLLQWPNDCKDASDLWLKHKGDVEGFRKLVERLTKEAMKKPVEVIDEEDEAPENIPICPPEVVSGGYIGELTRLLTEGTTIPPEFVFQNTSMILGAMVDGKIGFNSHEAIHTRSYSVNVSNLPRSGKGESWVRTGEETTGLLANILAERGLKIMDASLYGSGEFMVGSLSEYAKVIQKDDPTAPVNVIARCDEMAEIFEKSKTLGSTLQTKLLQMFERNSVSTGSFKNKEHAVHNLHFSVSGDFTFDGFQKAFAGQGAGGSGLLSRFTYAYAKRSPYRGRWPVMDNIGVIKVLAQIRECLDRLDDPKIETPVETPDDSLFAYQPKTRFIPRRRRARPRCTRSSSKSWSWRPESSPPNCRATSHGIYSCKPSSRTIRPQMKPGPSRQ
jgi:CHC2 zinc finger